MANRSLLADIYLALGAIDLAIEQAELAMQWADRILPLLRPMAVAAVALAQLAAYGPGGAAASISVPVEFPPDNAFIWVVESAMRARTALDLASGDLRRAETSTAMRVERLRAAGLRLFLPDALTAQAEVALRIGQPATARAALEEATALARAMGARMSLWAILAVSAGMDEAQGRPGEAATARAEAKQILSQIVDGITPAELRQSFIARPQVHDLLTRQ